MHSTTLCYCLGLVVGFSWRLPQSRGRLNHCRHWQRCPEPTTFRLRVSPVGSLRPPLPENAPPLSQPSLDLSRKHFIVTGGTQGLGLEIARQLKSAGATRLALLSRTRSKGDSAVEQLTDGSCVAYFVEVDVANPKSLEDGTAAAIEALGGHVDGLVCAAATTERGNLMTTTAEMFDKQFDINTRAPFLLTQAVAKHMIAKKIRGSIVHISSVAAKGGAPFITAYSASKAALNVIVQNNAAELAPHGIRVNSINMGWTATDNEDELQRKQSGEDWLTKADAGVGLGRILRPADAASTVCFLMSPAAEMMTGNVVSLHPEAMLGLVSASSVDNGDRD